jgi:hypothetical protein
MILGKNAYRIRITHGMNLLGKSSMRARGVTEVCVCQGRGEVRDA